MQSKAKDVTTYMEEIPGERKEALAACVTCAAPY
jgi:hypothetical protein